MCLPTMGEGTGAPAARISPDEAALPAYVVAVDEERWIARETVRCLRAAGGGERGKHG